MNEICFLMIIVKRSDGENYIELCKENGMPLLFGVPCHGTAKRKMLDFWGIEETEKTALFTVASYTTACRLTRRFTEELQMNLPNHGIAAAVPIHSVGGNAMLRNFTYRCLDTESGEKKMEAGTASQELIIAILKNGTAQTVMDAAREAGATGGTVIHAKEIATEYAQKFFGVSIAEEKEMLYIIAETEKRNAIMKALMQEKAFVFSLPIAMTAGLHGAASADAEE